MKNFIKNILSGALAIVGLTLALPAQAVLTSYTVDGVAPIQLTAPTTPPADAPWGVNGYPGDTVALQSYTGTFDLTVGTSIQKINSLLWTVDYTYGGTATDANAWSDVSFNLSADRNITIGGQTATLSQTGSLTAAWDNDYLGLAAGSTISLFAQGYQVDITPIAVPITGATSFDGSNPWAQPSQDVYAQFVVSAIPGDLVNAPEPGSIAALAGLVLISCGSPMASRLRAKKALL